MSSAFGLFFLHFFRRADSFPLFRVGVPALKCARIRDHGAAFLLEAYARDGVS
jgi:hypothetical protein